MYTKYGKVIGLKHVYLFDYSTSEICHSLNALDMSRTHCLGILYNTVMNKLLSSTVFKVKMS